MRILLVAKPWKGGLGRYMHLALNDMFPGCVTWVPTRPTTFSEYINFRRDGASWWAARLQHIEKTVCDVAFFVGYRKEFRSLKPRDRNVLFFIDRVSGAPGDLDMFSRIFLSDPGYVPELKSIVAEEKYGGVLPFAHYPRLHQPAPYAGPKNDLCFLGNRDAKRDLALKYLFSKGIAPQITGNYFLNSPLFWRHPLDVKPSVSNEGMGRVYARHRISLNIHAAVVREGTNMRTFECAGYGIPQIVEYRPSIENYFEPEKEILLYREPNEMVEQISALLADPSRAQQMALQARNRAKAEHTYHQRLAKVLEYSIPKTLLTEAMQRVREVA